MRTIPTCRATLFESLGSSSFVYDLPRNKISVCTNNFFFRQSLGSLRTRTSNPFVLLNHHALGLESADAFFLRREKKIKQKKTSHTHTHTPEMQPTHVEARRWRNHVGRNNFVGWSWVVDPLSPSTRMWPEWREVADVVYCLTLDDRPDRHESARQQLNRVGLAGRTVFCMNRKDTSPDMKRPWTRGIFEAHRLAALDGLARGARRILVFEDDVVFARDISRLDIEDVVSTTREIPKDWTMLLLGATPVLGARMPVDRYRNTDIEHQRRSVYRAPALCMHAYILSERGMRMLAETPFDAKRAMAIDTFMGFRPTVYAIHPLLAYQAPLSTDNAKASINEKLHMLVTDEDRCNNLSNIVYTTWTPLFFFFVLLCVLLCLALFRRTGFYKRLPSSSTSASPTSLSRRQNRASLLE